MTKNNLKVVKSTKAQQAEGNEKNKALDAAMSQIIDNFGKGSVMKLGQRRAMDIRVSFNRIFKLRCSAWNRWPAKRKSY